jgi:hypothetical protein
MSVTYYVALPFVRTEDGVAPGEAQEMPNEGAAIRRPRPCRGIPRMPARSRSSVAVIRIWETLPTLQF